MSNNIFGTASMPLIKVQDGMNGVPGKPGKDGATTYTWIKYANDINGNGISNSPVSKEYIGFAYNKTTNVESNNPSDYTWSLIKGEDGTDGIDGAPGEDGKTTYTWIKYSSTEDGKEMTEIPDSNTKYIGIAVNKLEKVESNNPKDYTWSKFVGEDGEDGTDGKDGINGAPGEDGKTTYTWVKYSKGPKGEGMTEGPTEETLYIGIAVNKLNKEESNNPSDYTWSKFIGDDGIAGKPGKDGQTTYTWIKYAKDMDGTSLTNDPTGMTHIGFAYNKTTSVESSNPKDYMWSLIKGSDGKDGTQGPQGVPGKPGLDGKTTYTWIRYAKDANGTGISNNPTGMTYIGFAYNKNTPTESTNPKDYMWSLIKGKDGVKGQDGKDGVSTYTWIKYSNNKNGTPMVDEPTTMTKYIGIAVDKNTEVESTNPSDYTWSKFIGEDGKDGAQGAPGVPGKPGKDGQTTYTWIKYADTDKGVGISDSPIGKKYIGFSYNKTTSVESNTPSDYIWSLIKGEDGKNGSDGKIGVQGPPGKDGKPTYTWIKYAKDINGNGMTEEPTLDTKFIGIATNKTTATESTNPKDYTWSKFVGEDGKNGKDGAQGPQGVPGKPGVDGEVTYTWIRYADDIDGSGISNSPIGKKYIGFAYNKKTSVESNNPKDYAWSLIKGEDGENSYTWIRYSDFEDGKNFYEKPKDSTKSIGFAITTVNKAPTNINDYAWSEFTGRIDIGGRNYFILKNSIEGLVSTGGFIAESDARNLLSDFIEIDRSTDYIYSTWSYIEHTNEKMRRTWHSIAFYDENKKFTGKRPTYGSIQGENGETIYESKNITDYIRAEKDAKYMRIGSRYITSPGMAKLEKGNKPTDWTPALEDIEVSFGGRNLIVDHLSTQGFLSITGAIGKQSVDERTTDFIEIDKDSKLIYTAYPKVPSYLSTTGKKTWNTLIFYNDKKQLLGNRKVMKEKNYVKGMKEIWDVGSLIRDHPSKNSIKYIRISSSWMEEGKWKLENGNIVSDWSPSPEDIEFNSHTGTRNLVTKSNDIDMPISTNPKESVIEKLSDNSLSITTPENVGLEYCARFFGRDRIIKEYDKIPDDTIMTAVMLMSTEGLTKQPELHVGDGNSYLRLNGEINKKYTLFTRNFKKREDVVFHLSGGPGKYIVHATGIFIGSRVTDWVPAKEDMEKDITELENRVNDISDDSKLTPNEKQIVSKDYKIIQDEKPILDKQADNYKVDKTKYNNAFTTLKNYIEPLLKDPVKTSDIDKNTFIKMFADYNREKVNLQNEISNAIEKQEGPQGKPGESSYNWIRYSDKPDGTGFYEKPKTSTMYIGLATTKINVAPTKNTDYSWALIKGANGLNGSDGEDGVQGPPGKDGKPTYTWIKYSANETGTPMTEAPDKNTKYIGIATNKTTATESTNPKDYIWSRFVGEDGKNGKDGAQGPQGVPGKPGVDGKTTYTWIKYAKGINGENISNDPTGMTYIGFAYNKTTPTESNNPKDYMWSLIKGKDGVKGQDGKDGVSTYTWIKYSQNENGTLMTDNPTSMTKYIGIAVGKNAPTESTNPSDYTWSKFVGEDGKNGKDGAPGVPGKPGKDGQTTYTWIKYADTINGVGISDSPIGKKYIGFAYNKTTPVESNTPSDYIWSLIKGEDGENGSDGKNGVNGAPGKDGETTYTWIKYANDINGNGMTEEPTLDTKFIGIATNKTTATESTNPKDYTWSKFIGEDGRDGVPGKPGVDGRTPYLHTAWANSSDGMEGFTTEYPNENLLVGRIKDIPIASNNESLYPIRKDYLSDKDGDFLRIKREKIESYPNTLSLYSTLGPDLISFENVIGKTITMQFSIRASTKCKFTVMSSTIEGQPLGEQGKGIEVNKNWTTHSRTVKIPENTKKGIRFNPQEVGIGNIKDFFVDMKDWKIEFGDTPTIYTPSSKIDFEGSFPTYVGISSTNTEKQPVDPTAYSWSRLLGESGKDGMNGVPGKPGADGRTPYFHTAWADSPDGKLNFSVSESAYKKYMGTYSDFTKEDSKDPSKYKWVNLANSVEVGGRNLLFRTHIFDSMSGARGVLSNEMFDGNHVLTSVEPNAPNYSDTFSQKTIHAPRGSVYTCSFWAKADKDKTNILNYFYSPNTTIKSINSQGKVANSTDGQSTIALSTKWERYWITWEQNETTTPKFIILGRIMQDGYSKVHISSPMFTQGRIPMSWSPAPEDIDEEMNNIENGIGNLEEGQKPENIWESLVTYPEFESLFDEKANAQDIEDLANAQSDFKQDLDGIQATMTQSQESMGEEINKMTSRLELNENKMEMRFAMSKGLNLIRNSTGWFGLDDWEKAGNSGLIETVGTRELEEFGLGHAFYLKTGVYQEVSQKVRVDPGQNYTLSYWTKFHTTVPTNYQAVSIIIGEQNNILKPSSNGSQDRYGRLSKSFTIPNGVREVTIKLFSGNSTDGYVSGIMLNTGPDALQWSSHPEEIANTNIRMNLNGIRVEGANQYTIMSPDEFSGYANVLDEKTNTVSEERVFTLNGETTEVNRLKAEKTINLGSIIMQAIDSGEIQGIAFAGTD